jgi:signal peptidase II
MPKQFRLSIILFFTIAGIFIIDQNIKSLFVDGYFLDGDCISLELHYNKGVAFYNWSKYH